MDRANKKILTVFTILLMLTALRMLSGESFQVLNGYLDLSAIDLAGAEGIPLVGKWEVYRNRMLLPEYFKKEKSGETELITIPDFKFLESEEKLSSNIITTFRLQIKMGEQNRDKIFGLVVPFIYSTYDIWINGEIYCNAFSSVDSTQRRDILFFYQSGDTLELILQGKNFWLNKGRFHFPIILSTPKRVKLIKWLSLRYQFVLIGCLLIMGLYHIGLFFYRKQDKSSLFFGLYCFLIMGYTTFRGENLFLLAFPSCSYELAYRLEIIFLFLNPLILSNFIFHLCSDEFKDWKIIQLYSLVYLVLCGIVPVLSLEFLTHAFYLFYLFLFFIGGRLAFALYNSMKKKNKSSILFFISYMLLVAAGVNDLLNYFIGLQTYWVSAGCVVLFFFIKFFTLARRFTGSFTAIESMRNKLIEKKRSLKKLDKLKDEFLAKTSKELKEPLLDILNTAVDLFKTTRENREFNNNMGLICTSMNRLSILVNNIRDYSALKNGSLIMETRKIDLGNLMEHVISLVEVGVWDKRLEVINDITPGNCFVEGDRIRVKQILYNLIDQSIKVSEDGFIKVSAYKKDNRLFISIRNKGIPLEAGRSISCSFKLKKSSSGKLTSGVGLELKLTRLLVDLHGGRLGFKTDPGKFSIFKFSLPVFKTMLNEYSIQDAYNKDREKDPEPAERDARAMIDRREAPDNFKHFVLIVDNDPLNIKVLKNNLKLEKISFVTASSGPEAINILKKNFYIELILMDITIPGMDGYETCRYIRKNLMRKQVYLPIIMITSKNETDFYARGYKAGANDFISKPCYREELATRISFHVNLTHTRKELDELKANLEDMVEQKSDELLNINQKIIDSMNYANIIQTSMLPVTEKFEKAFKDHFIIWEPKEIVGGDFYWFHEIDPNHFLVAVIDCSGYEVSGAFLAITVNTLLDRIVNHIVNNDPAAILMNLNTLTLGLLEEKSYNTFAYEGHNISLCHFNKEAGEVTFAGAGQSLFFMQNGKLVESKGDNQSIGHKNKETDLFYTNFKISLEGNEVFYLFTDGYLVQHDEAHFALGKKRFREYLYEAAGLSLEEQRIFLKDKFSGFMGTAQQHDDITVLGLKL